MMFAQLTYRESLRDIEVCLRSYRRELYQLGNRVFRSTLADANCERDLQVFNDLAYRQSGQEVLWGRSACPELST